ncbi:DUF5058 family protein [Zhihengliuella salsuginis]|uniref:DUF5058 domain-containing protein n=1 Tax=Zhihengliuella salsuginis TaxID=578222 RepID=A0ABQ3GL89_9MICC|nr:DUF5058 family protein [Zhihengliuella salsuginis]GHD13051.1 DUF5058 domain-containing protein [Zhihengliuella salsuginis]
MSSTPAAAAASGASTDIAAVANSPILWIFALGVFAVIFVQTAIYMKAARTAGTSVGLDNRDLTRALRSGAISSVGPSLAVVIVAIALLALFGTPAVLVRIGLIGSVSTEVASATIASGALGADLGGPDYTQTVYAVAFIAMSLSGGAWMLATLLLTPIMKRGGNKLAEVNPAAMALIPGAALLGAFSTLTVAELPKSGLGAITVAVSTFVMAGLLFAAKKLNAGWLKEWALGISIIVALTFAYFAHTATVA